jgi:hypothetical protein
MGTLKKWAMRSRVPAVGALAILLVTVSGALATHAGYLKLAHSNTAPALTALNGTLAGPVFQVLNGGAGAALRLVNTDGGPGLQIQVASGQPPIIVNPAAGKATNLSADKLDGLDSTQLQRRVSATCTAGSSIRAIAAAGTSVTCEVDNDSGGDITSVSAGAGLTGGGTSGAVSLGADFAGTGSAGTVARSDHNHDTRYQAPYVRTTVVRPVGTAIQNGTALEAALAAVSGASATNPYLLKLEPGIYDVGANGMDMKAFVDIEGSGEGMTKITSTGWGACCQGTVDGASNSELRFLTIENTGATGNAFAIIAQSASSFRIVHVTARAPSVEPTRDAIGIGIFNSGGIVIDETTVQASGGPAARAIHIANTSAAITDTTARASGAALNVGLSILEGDTVDVRDSVLTAQDGTSYGLYATGASGSQLVSIDGSQLGGATNRINETAEGDAEYFIRVGASMLSGGPAVGTTGALSCVASYEPAIGGVYVAVDATCN